MEKLTILFFGLGLLVNGIDHIGHFALAVPVLPAGDVPGLSCMRFSKARSVPEGKYIGVRLLS